MKRACLMIAGALGLAVASAPSPAQLTPGYSGFPGVTYLGQEEIWWAIRELGYCFAGNKANQARALLATVPGTAAEGQAVRGLLGSETACLRNATSARLPIPVIRGTVAEGLYRRAVARSRGAPPAAPATQAAAPGASGKGLSLDDFAACYVASRPDEAHRLLMTTRLGTREEHAEISRLAPSFAACVPGAVRFEGAAPYVRMAIAEAMYRRFVAGQPQQRAR